MHLYSTFSVDPRNFQIGVNLYQNVRFFRDIWAVAHIFKARAVKFGMRVRTWDSFP